MCQLPKLKTVRLWDSITEFRMNGINETSDVEICCWNVSSHKLKLIWACDSSARGERNRACGGDGAAVGWERDARAKTGLGAWGRCCLVTSCRGTVMPSEGRVSRGGGTAGQQEFKHPRDVSAQPSTRWLDLGESLLGWMEKSLHLTVSHFQGTQARHLITWILGFLFSQMGQIVPTSWDCWEKSRTLEGVWQVPNNHAVGGSIFIFILDASESCIHLTMRMPWRGRKWVCETVQKGVRGGKYF